jgi:hypothetical protein
MVEMEVGRGEVIYQDAAASKKLLIGFVRVLPVATAWIKQLWQG